MTVAPARVNGRSRSSLARRFLEGHRAIWVACGAVGALGFVAVFLPAAEVEFGASGKIYNLVPMRDSLAIAAIPLAASVCLIVIAVVALLTNAPRTVLIALALLATLVGGARGLDVSAGFTGSDTRGAGAWTSGPKSAYGGDLFDALVNLSADHPETRTESGIGRGGDEIAADVFWGTGWYLLMASMLALSLVLTVRLLWFAIPLWAATYLGLVSVVVWWVVVVIVTFASRGEFE
jgi:hypothetical protein